MACSVINTTLTGDHGKPPKARAASVVDSRVHTCVCVCVCLQSLYFLLSRIHMITFRAHLDNAKKSPHLRLFSLLISAKVILPSKETLMGSGDQDVDRALRTMISATPTLPLSFMALS